MQNRVPVVFLKFKLLFACLALCLCVNAGLFAQSKKFVQKIQWQPDENAFGYRVEVRSKTADSKPKVIETEDSFVELSLTPGKYEYRVTAVDFLGREAVSSDWTEFEIIKALLPEIVQTENKVVAPEEVMRTSRGYYAAVKEHGTSVGKFRTELNVVRDHENGHSPLLQFVHDPSKGEFEERVQSLGGLVQKKYLGLQKKNFTQSQPLLFSS